MIFLPLVPQDFVDLSCHVIREKVLVFESILDERLAKPDRVWGNFVSVDALFG
jgi:hypothetical protein